MLDKYRHDHLVFNDDIQVSWWLLLIALLLNQCLGRANISPSDVQGTGATALAGLLGALRAKGEEVTSLGEQRIVIVGAGSAGIGIGQVLLQAMMEQGCSEEKAKKAFFVVDQHGLIGTDRLDTLTNEQKPFARAEDDQLPLKEVVKKYKPTILIGVTAYGGLFTQDLIEEMAAHEERPIIFPLSNPTTKAECTAEQAFEWTNGKCIFASGSPFEPVELSDGRKFYPSQCNNSK